MAKSATKAAPAPEVKTRKGSSRSAKKPRNPARAEKNMAKASRAKASGERKRAFAAAASPSDLPSPKADSYSNRKARRAAWRKANPELAANREASRKNSAPTHARAALKAFAHEAKAAKRLAHALVQDHLAEVAATISSGGIPVGSAMVVAAGTGAA